MMTPIRAHRGHLPLFFCTALLAASSDASGNPNGHYLGLGAMHGTVQSDNTSIDGESGHGLHLFGGLFLLQRLAWEIDVGGFTISTGEVESPYYPKDEADYSLIATGPVLFFNDPEENTWAPWVSLYGSLHYVTWNSYAYDLVGLGISPGAGLDLRVYGGMTFRLATRLHFSQLESSYDSGKDPTTVRIFTLDLYYRF